MVAETDRRAARHTILLVEDESDTRSLLARALERAGHRCLSASGPAEALAHAGAQPRLGTVVADVILDGDDRGGLKVMRALRAQGIAAPVILITAYADLQMVKAALNEGAAHLLEKPFRAGELLAAIDRVHAPVHVRSSMDDLFSRARLTDKERTVARHLVAGLSSSEIAELERNSPKTIRQHVSQIYAKCGVTSRAEFFRLVYTS